MKVAVTTLAASVAALLGLGLVMLYSSSMMHGGGHELMMQLLWCVAGFLGCALLAAADYKVLGKLWWLFYILAVAGLVGVFVPHLGHASHGAHRWLKAGLTLQPSEFAKIALVIALAAYCDRNQRQMAAFKRGVALPGALASVILVLIFVEPDRGAAILLSTVTVAVLMVGGVCWKHILLPALGGAGIVAAEIWRDPLRMRRIMAWLHPQEHLNGAALQAQQAMIGLGSGGIFGVGLGNGVRKFGYLPEINTDFILANIGEELGLVATLAVVLLFVLIAICGITIALRAREPFGAFLAVGVTLLICLQAAINIGVVTSALPNKGLPLPFISYGGSNLVAMFACVGILFSVASRGRIRERVPAARDDAGYNPFAARVSA